MIVRAPSGPGMRASRLPESEPVSRRLSSSSTSSPSSRSSAASQSATGRSCREGLSISQSATKSSWSCALLSGPDLLPHAGLEFRRPLERPLARGAHEVPEQRLRAQRARLELGVVLRGHEEWVVGQLDDFDEAVVGRGPGAHEARMLEPLAEGVVHLVAVAVALVDHGLAVDLAGAGAVVELHGVGAEPHRATHVADLLLLRQEVDDREWRLGVELGGVRALHAGHVPREVGDGDLHAQADAQVRHAVLARVAGSCDLALDPALAEAAGDEEAIDGGELLARVLLRVDPDDLELAAVVHPGVVERLGDRQVGVGELVVLADEADADRRGGRVDPLHQAAPVGLVGRRRLELEVFEDLVVDALGAEVERHLVDRVDVARGDHRLDRQVREQRDLAADVAVELALGAAHDHVGLDADAAQLLHRVLGRLRLQLARVAEERHERQVDEHAAVAALVDLELAQRLEERQRLDVADRAADLGDHDVDLGRLGNEADAVLDLVGDVRDHLDGATEVVAAALAPDHRVVDRPRGGVRGPGGVHVGEALVVAQVEVGLRPVLGHEHLAVLERAHRARVDVDVGVELLDRHGQAARHQQLAHRGGGDALAESGDDTACDEDESSVRAALWHSALWEFDYSRTRGGSDRGPWRHAAASNSTAWRRAPASEASAPSIRHSSVTTASPSSASTLATASSPPSGGPPTGPPPSVIDFSIR